MEAKSVLYAAVGAPLAVARKVGSQVDALKGKLNEERSAYTKAAEKTLNSWAIEGEKVVTRISEGKVVEEISSKVDLDQAKEQVGKLRDQLEDMLATWRHSFRPEKAEEKTEAPPKKATAKKPAAKKPTAKTSAAKTTKSSTAAKTSSAKSASAKAEPAS